MILYCAELESLDNQDEVADKMKYYSTISA
jgi:hypothetical protein